MSLKILTTSSAAAGSAFALNLPAELTRNSSLNVLDASTDTVKKCSMRGSQLTALESLDINPTHGYIVSGAYISA